MLARKTENQITLPQAIASRFGDVDVFEIASEGDVITLRAKNKTLADEGREHLERIGITDQDIADAIAWARGDK